LNLILRSAPDTSFFILDQELCHPRTAVVGINAQVNKPSQEITFQVVSRQILQFGKKDHCAPRALGFTFCFYTFEEKNAASDWRKAAFVLRLNPE
jgi:hypothetical protein